MASKVVVFDLDGTLFPTHRITAPAVAEAFRRSGIPPVPDAEVIRLIGETSESIASSLLPAHSLDARQQFFSIVREHENRLLCEGAECYPGAVAMLNELRERGHVLGICSNGSGAYVENVLRSCGIRDYFARAFGKEPNATKAQRLRVLLDDIDAQSALFVGDREVDFAAARQCSLPSIAVTHGYGGDEVEQATFIAHSTEEITCHVVRCDIYREVETSICALPQSRPRIIGVNGVDTSGKTNFASGLASYLASRGRKVALIHLDDFHNPRSIRSSGTDPVAAYIDNAFNLNMLENEILRPIRQAGTLDRSLVLLDLETDTFSAVRRFVVDPQTVVILEGVLLYRPPIDQYFDFRIFLDVPFEEVIRRASIRDASPGDTSIVDRYLAKYIPVQKRYLAEHSPAERSDLVVDNTDYERPRVIGVV